MAETIILDPSELTSSRSQLDITPWIGPDGIDWGDASVSAYMAEASRGEIPVDYRVPNRSISGGLIFKGTVGGTTAVAARTAIQQKLSLIQREGGWVKRITPSGGTVYADLTNASFRTSSWSGRESRGGFEVGASFELEAIPDFYEAETTDSDNSTTTTRELLYTTALTSQGDSPMRCRIVVDNDGSTDWRGLIWCFRSKNYPGSTAATRNTGSASMVYEAESLGALDTAIARAGTAVYGTVTAAYWSGGTVVHHGTLSTSWTPVLGGKIGGTTYPTHQGSYQMFAKLASTSGTTVRARAVWDVGDLVNPTENAPVRLPGGTTPYIVDLGEMRLDPAPIGTHRWDWQIQGAGDAGSENLSVDKVWLANKDEGMGIVTANLDASSFTTTYISRSEFTTESGAINGDSLVVGGTWTTTGDATDFSESSDILTRAEVSDASNTGRYARAGSSTSANVTIRCDLNIPTTLSAATSSRFGILGRYTDTSNWFAIVLYPAPIAGMLRLNVLKRVGGSVTTISSPSPPIALGVWYTLELVLSGSSWTATAYSQGAGTPLITTSGTDADLAGTLASGGHGIYDEHATSTAGTRQYDNFLVYSSTPDAASYASQSIQLTTDGIYREDSGGTAYGPVSSVIGDLPRFPVPPQSGGTVEAMLIPSLGDFDTLPDTMGTASISAQNSRRPSWLFVDDT